ncbi:MAG TPA: hypothetical protein PLW68_13725 [Casimicrobiaceae bacterium]|nr:hypothetical protein [Casimicrobiaceae bacterium]
MNLDPQILVQQLPLIAKFAVIFGLHLLAGPYRSGKLLLTSRVMRIDGLRGFDDRMQSRRLGHRACLGDNSRSRLT